MGDQVGTFGGFLSNKKEKKHKFMDFIGMKKKAKTLSSTHKQSFEHINDSTSPSNVESCNDDYEELKDVIKQISPSHNSKAKTTCTSDKNYLNSPAEHMSSERHRKDKTVTTDYNVAPKSYGKGTIKRKTLKLQDKLNTVSSNKFQTVGRQEVHETNESDDFNGYECLDSYQLINNQPKTKKNSDANDLENQHSVDNMDTYNINNNNNSGISGYEVNNSNEFNTYEELGEPLFIKDADKQSFVEKNTSTTSPDVAPSIHTSSFSKSESSKTVRRTESDFHNRTITPNQDFDNYSGLYNDFNQKAVLKTSHSVKDNVAKINKELQKLTVNNKPSHKSLPKSRPAPKVPPKTKYNYIEFMWEFTKESYKDVFNSNKHKRNSKSDKSISPMLRRLEEVRT